MHHIMFAKTTAQIAREENVQKVCKENEYCANTVCGVYIMNWNVVLGVRGISLTVSRSVNSFWLLIFYLSSSFFVMFLLFQSTKTVMVALETETDIPHATEVDAAFKTSLPNISKVLFSLFIRAAEEECQQVFSIINSMLMRNKLRDVQLFWCLWSVSVVSCLISSCLTLANIQTNIHQRKVTSVCRINSHSSS